MVAISVQSVVLREIFEFVASLLYQDLTGQVIGIAIKVHKSLGPGFVEKVYQRAIIQELKNQKIPYEIEKVIIIKYKGAKVGQQRLDLVVDDKVIIEVKATDNMPSISENAYLSLKNYNKSFKLQKPANAQGFLEVLMEMQSSQ